MSGNSPAFPTEVLSAIGSLTQKGLTKREYFSALALQGILANPEIMGQYANDILEEKPVTPPAELALFHADQLLEFLEQKE